MPTMTNVSAPRASVLAIAVLGLLVVSCSSDDSSDSSCDVTNTATINIRNSSSNTPYQVVLDGAPIGTITPGDTWPRVVSAGSHTVQFLSNGTEACLDPVNVVACQITTSACNDEPLPCEQGQYGEWTFVNGSATVDYEVYVDGVVADLVTVGDQTNPVQLSPGDHAIVFRNAATDQISCQQNITVDVCDDRELSCASP